MNQEEFLADYFKASAFVKVKAVELQRLLKKAKKQEQTIQELRIVVTNLSFKVGTNKRLKENLLEIDLVV